MPIWLESSDARLLRKSIFGFVAGWLAACAGGTAATAQQSPSAMELLGKAQSNAERQAVEDLITKLQARPAIGQQPSPPAVAIPLAKPAEEPSSSNDKNQVSPIKSSPSTGSGQILPAAEPTGVAPVAPVTTPVAPAIVMPAPATPAVVASTEAVLPSADILVYFDFGSYTVDSKAAEALGVLGRALSDPRLAKAIFLIAGHTDAKGRPDYNLELSQHRAEAVRQHLITTYGLAPSRLVALGFGDTRPKDPLDRLSDVNRRVQVVNVTTFAQN